MSAVCFQFLFSKMEKIEVKYFQQTEFGRKPIKATKESAGYDFFASHSKTISPGECAKISLDLHWAIPTGFCGRVLGRSSLVTEHSVTVEGGYRNHIDMRSTLDEIIEHNEELITSNGLQKFLDNFV